MDKSLEKRTRKVFHEIHLDHLSDPDVRERHTRVVDPEIMSLPNDYFSGLTCGDLGCGSAVHGTVNLLSLGAAHVCALDLDDSFVKSAKKRLEDSLDFEGRWTLDIGSLLELPYENERFDFILCAGVIHHVSDDHRAINEIYRVLKKGGKAYLSVTGGTGLLNRFWMDIARDEYFRSEEMQKIIREGRLEEWLKFYLTDLRENIDIDDDESYRASILFIESLIGLIDNDLVLSIRDVLEAPKYKTYTESQWLTLLSDCGFIEAYRFFKKPKYKNIRKVVAPLYHDYKNPLARVLYGDGSMNVIVTK